MSYYRFEPRPDVRLPVRLEYSKFDQLRGWIVAGIFLVLWISEIFHGYAPSEKRIEYYFHLIFYPLVVILNLSEMTQVIDLYQNKLRVRWLYGAISADIPLINDESVSIYNHHLLHFISTDSIVVRRGWFRCYISSKTSNFTALKYLLHPIDR